MIIAVVDCRDRQGPERYGTIHFASGRCVLNGGMMVLNARYVLCRALVVAVVLLSPCLASAQGEPFPIEETTIADVCDVRRCGRNSGVFNAAMNQVDCKNAA